MPRQSVRAYRRRGFTRNYSGARAAAVAKRRSMPGPMRGYYRKSGYYGRFAGRSGEQKFFDTSVDDSPIPVALTATNLTVVPEGNGESDRIGRKITIKKIYWKYQFVLPTTATAADTSDIVRLMLVQDTQTNGAQFVATDLLDSDVYDSFRNLANSSRFRVLMSKDIPVSTMAGVGSTAAFGENRKWQAGAKFCSIPIEYDNSANTGAITTVRTNNLYWVTQSVSGLCQAVGTVRIRYTDQ